MSTLSEDIRALVAKYGDTHDPSDILKKVSTLCEIELSNIALHKRLDDDVFELFDKENEDEMKMKHRLTSLARVISHHTASSCSQFVIESVIEFSEDNLTIQDVGSLRALPAVEKSNKRKSRAHIMQVDCVRLYYEYNEQSVGSAERAPGQSVLESPCKTINLTISMSRGAAGLDKCVVIDFEMLTAKFSPSENQVLLNSNDIEGTGDDADDNADDPDDADDATPSEVDVDEDRSADEKSEALNEEGDSTDNEDANYDVSDYYNVRVDRDALEQVRRVD